MPCRRLPGVGSDPAVVGAGRAGLAVGGPALGGPAMLVGCGCGRRSVGKYDRRDSAGRRGAIGSAPDL
jgi:hypothetical protein